MIYNLSNKLTFFFYSSFETINQKLFRIKILSLSAISFFSDLIQKSAKNLKQYILPISSFQYKKINDCFFKSGIIIKINDDQLNMQKTENEKKWFDSISSPVNLAKCNLVNYNITNPKKYDSIELKYVESSGSVGLNPEIKISWHMGNSKNPIECYLLAIKYPISVKRELVIKDFIDLKGSQIKMNPFSGFKETSDMVKQQISSEYSPISFYEFCDIDRDSFRYNIDSSKTDFSYSIEIKMNDHIQRYFIIESCDQELLNQSQDISVIEFINKIQKNKNFAVICDFIKQDLFLTKSLENTALNE